MKKLALIILLALCSLPAFAGDKMKLFVIKNVTPSQVTDELGKKLGSAATIDNNVIYSVSEKYYIKSYSAEKNTELFLNSDNKKIEELSNVISNLNNKAYSLEDKATIKKYQTDFENYVLENNLAFSKVKAKENQKGYKKYNPYSKKIKNRIVGTVSISTNGIQIKRIQYVPKYKVRKKANEYEYVITNNTGKDIVINKVASEGFIGLTQIAAYCAIPQWQDFVPLYGIIYGIQSDIEKNKFTRQHPVNEKIKAGDTMRVLALSKQADNPIADFYFTAGENKITITFDPSKGEK